MKVDITEIKMEYIHDQSHRMPSGFTYVSIQYYNVMDGHHLMHVTYSRDDRKLEHHKVMDATDLQWPVEQQQNHSLLRWWLTVCTCLQSHFSDPRE